MPISINGKTCIVKGEKVKLYPIRRLTHELARVGIKRSTQTIRKWELKGVMPKCIFREQGNRMYTKEQIQVIVRVALECNIKKGLDIASTDFPEKIWQELNQINEKYK